LCGAQQTERKNVKLYLAGPMRNYPLLNSREFDRVARILEEEGYTVVNPIDLDRQEGLNFTTEETIQATAVRLPNGTIDEEHYLARDFQYLATCDGVALLDGWKDSVGTQREIAEGKRLGMRTRPWKEWML
jgi:nucleoside 2-deoxyribosyltransferase